MRRLVDVYRLLAESSRQVAESIARRLAPPPRRALVPVQVARSRVDSVHRPGRPGRGAPGDWG